MVKRKAKEEEKQITTIKKEVKKIDAAILEREKAITQDQTDLTSWKRFMYFYHKWKKEIEEDKTFKEWLNIKSSSHKSNYWNMITYLKIAQQNK